MWNRSHADLTRALLVATAAALAACSANGPAWDDHAPAADGGVAGIGAPADAAGATGSSAPGREPLASADAQSPAPDAAATDGASGGARSADARDAALGGGTNTDAQGRGADRTYSVKIPKTGTLIADPSYHLFVPGGAGVIRAVIIHHHGCGREGDAAPMVNDLHWRTLARKWDAVLLAPASTTGSNCGNWNDPQGGSRATFLEALKVLAVQSGHPELVDAPWAIWGHSSGGTWANRMMVSDPDRVVSAFPRSSCATDPSVNAATLRIPVMYNEGRADLCSFGRTAFPSGRGKGGLWGHSIDPTANGAGDGHGCKKSRVLAIPFFDAVFAQRLPPAASGKVGLLDVDPSSGWLGDGTTGAIVPASSNPPNARTLTWLPSEAVAKIWQEFQMTGNHLKDATLPPAPHRVAVTRSADGAAVTLTWEASSDLETGTKAFHVYRNGVRVGTAPGQGWGYGDNPEPSSAALRFIDPAPGSSAAYQVSQVSWANLEGPRSEVVRVP